MKKEIKLNEQREKKALCEELSKKIVEEMDMDDLIGYAQYHKENELLNDKELFEIVKNDYEDEK